MVQVGDVTIQDEAVILPSAKVVLFSRDTTVASGTQAITGVGFRPSSVIFLAHQDGVDEASWGVDDGVTPRSFGDNVGTYQSQGSFSLADIESGANVYVGRVTSFDVDGFTVTWTKQNTPTGTFTCNALCFK
jgi:hypothetical protein